MPPKRRKSAPTETTTAAKKRKSDPNRQLEDDKGEPRGRRVIDFEKILLDSDIVPNPKTTTTDGICQTEEATGSAFDNSPTASSRSVNLQIFNEVGCNPIRLAGDDLTLHVPNTLKQQICRREYINLSLLLKGSVELSEFCAGQSLMILKSGVIEAHPKEYKDYIPSIDKWTDAFIIYMAIYLSEFPNAAPDMLKYMATIRECAGRPGFAWRTYDKQFRLRQAASPSSWAATNHDLWCRCMGTPDLQANPDATRPKTPLRYPCLAFNKGSCSWPECKFQHACMKCGRGHPMAYCTLTQGSEPTRAPFERSNFPPMSSKPTFRGQPSQRRPGPRGRGYTRGGFRA